MLTMPVHPSTPNQDSPRAPPNRRLWSSPPFSDYFSGDDGASWTTSPTKSLKPSAPLPDNVFDADADASPAFLLNYPATLARSMSLPAAHAAPPQTQAQRELLLRLNAIARAIVAADDLTEHHCHQLQSDVDRLEQTLAAPDAQTRDPAEAEEMGLFDEESEATVGTEKATVTQHEEDLTSSEYLDTMARVSRAAKDLKMRFEEIKVCPSGLIWKEHWLMGTAHQ